jgi:hypothetical protein
MGSGWWIVVAGLGAWSWQMGCAAAMTRVGLAILGLWVETQRRRTLVALVEHAPKGTVVVMTEAAELPAVWMRVGPDHGSPDAPQNF